MTKGDRGTDIWRDDNNPIAYPSRLTTYIGVFEVIPTGDYRCVEIKRSQRNFLRSLESCLTTRIDQAPGSQHISFDEMLAVALST